jgi:hypothetical protein
MVKVDIRMTIRKTFASLALATVITTGVFGMCALQHTFGHNMRYLGSWITSDIAATSCPLSPIADFNPLEKFSQADPIVYATQFAPIGQENLAMSVFPQIEVQESPKTNSNKGPDRPGDIVYITSPPLAWAFSQGILHPKKDSIA